MIEKELKLKNVSIIFLRKTVIKVIFPCASLPPFKMESQFWNHMV